MAARISQGFPGAQAGPLAASQSHLTVFDVDCVRDRDPDPDPDAAGRVAALDKVRETLRDTVRDAEGLLD